METGDARSQIIEAGLQQVRDNGLESLSVRTVAARAHYSAAGLYRHFDSIDELRQAITLEVSRDLKKHLHDRLDGLQQPIARPAGRAIAEWVDDNVELSALLLQTPTTEFLFGPGAELHDDEDQALPWMAFVRSDATPEEKRRVAIFGWDLLKSLISMRAETPDFDFERAFEAAGANLRDTHGKGII